VMLAARNFLRFGKYDVFHQPVVREALTEDGRRFAEILGQQLMMRSA
jgi:hypothetical protein